MYRQPDGDPMTALSKILIADDDAIFLGITVSMVKQMGFAVITASDGQGAVELFEQHEKSIDYVLLDINMPRMNGISAFRQIRSLCQNVKVIIISGCLNGANREKLSFLRPVAYLQKPISFDLLSEALDSTSSC